MNPFYSAASALRIDLGEVDTRSSSAGREEAKPRTTSNQKHVDAVPWDRVLLEAKDLFQGLVDTDHFLDHLLDHLTNTRDHRKGRNVLKTEVLICNLSFKSG